MQPFTNVNTFTNVIYKCNVPRGTHPRPPAAAAIDACETTPFSVKNRAAEGGRAAVVREVVTDGAGGGSGVKAQTDVAAVPRGRWSRNGTDDPRGGRH